MAYRWFDYECPTHGVFEEMINDDSMSLPCPVCTEKSDRQLAAPRLDWRNMGLDPGFPTAQDKWAKAQIKRHTGKTS